MIKSNKNKKKKKGFTLVELVAVIAIIGILAAVLVPKISGYVKEAKKVETIDQARKVVTAGASIEIKTGSKPADKMTLAEVETQSGGLVIAKELDKLNGTYTATYGDCVKILDSKNWSFEVDKEGILTKTPTAMGITTP